MTTVTIVETSTGKEIDVSQKAFDTIYREKGFTLKPAAAAKEAKADDDQVLGQTGEQAVPAASVPAGSAGSGDAGGVRGRKQRKGSGPAGT